MKKNHADSKWTALRDLPEETSVGKADDETAAVDLDDAFRLDTIQRDLQGRKKSRAPAAKSLTQKLPQVPVKHLVPEWQAIAPTGPVEGDDGEEELPRYELSDSAPTETEHLPGTVAESSSEELDDLFAASAHLSAHRLDRALVSLRNFLDRDPRHAYADRAERLIAEGYAQAGEWSLAIAAANHLAASFPGTLAAADAVRIRERALRALGLPVATSRQ